MSKRVYKLGTIDVDSLIKRETVTGVTSVSFRNRDTWELYRDGAYIGTDSNSIGVYGTSDFWDYDDDGAVISTAPDIDKSIFVDDYYNVVVVDD